MSNKNLYDQLGVSHGKEEVHAAIKGLDKGLYPQAFCKILPDVWQNDPDYVNLMHADTAGTKTSLAYLYWRETGDYSVWKGIAQDALVMNLDDMACVGAVNQILISSTIGRNKHLIDGKVISTLIEGAQEFIALMKDHGVNLVSAGGETADVGDIVRTIDVGYTTAVRMPKEKLFVNKISPGLDIVGISSSGQSSYESAYNSGIGSNGLTGARHQLLSNYHREKYPESCAPHLSSKIAYSGKFKITDTVKIDGETYSMKQLLLSPTRTYLPVLHKIFEENVSGIAGIIHNTGGALSKVLKFIDDLRVVKNNLVDLPPVFSLLKDSGQMSFREMHQVYNLGQRLEIYVDKNSSQEIIDIAREYNIEAQVIGHTEASEKRELVIERGNWKEVY